MAYPHVAADATRSTFLAMRGMTGPLEVFEGNKGFMDAITGKFHIDWQREDLERVTQTCIKKYNAEIHSQSAIEGLLELQSRHGFKVGDVKQIDVEIFQVAFDIIGGGEEGNKKDVRTKEQADHSLPYILAVALLDGQVMPAQYEADRIVRQDVQGLMQRILVRPTAKESGRFPAQLPCRLIVTRNDGARFVIDKGDYEGFFTRQMSWETVMTKFERLSEPHTTPDLRKEIISAVGSLEDVSATELLALLAKVQGVSPQTRRLDPAQARQAAE